jgi:superfamily II DNA helicase RecQ
MTCSPNLRYEVRAKPSSANALADEIDSFIKRHKYQSSCGIIYCYARKECETLSATLSERGTTLSSYYAATNASLD